MPAGGAARCEKRLKITQGNAHLGRNVDRPETRIAEAAFYNVRCSTEELAVYGDTETLDGLENCAPTRS
jgi:hypothetical protein